MPKDFTLCEIVQEHSSYDIIYIYMSPFYHMFPCFFPRKWQPNEEQRLEDATVNKAVAKYGAQKGWKEGW